LESKTALQPVTAILELKRIMNSEINLKSNPIQTEFEFGYQIDLEMQFAKNE